MIKLIGTAQSAGEEIKLNAAPKQLDENHSSAAVNSDEKATTCMTDITGDITVMGGKSSPVDVAALLKDLFQGKIR